MFSEQVKATTVTADGTAFTGKGDFYGVSLNSTGSVIIYDNTAASGTIIMACPVPGMMLPAGLAVRFENGLHVDLTTATQVTVYYIPRGA